MAETLIESSSEKFFENLRTASFLNNKSCQNISQLTPETSSMDSGTWQAASHIHIESSSTRTSSNVPFLQLLQAHLANLSSHKAMLELLAQGLLQQGAVDPTLAASLENMYERTGGALEDALSVQQFFSEFGKTCEAPAPAPETTTTIPTAALKPERKNSNGQLFAMAKRRKRDEDDLPIFIATKSHKKTKLDDPLHSRPTPPPPPPPPPPAQAASQQEPGVEYEDISGEVKRRLAEAREKRLREKAALKEDKRKRESMDSANSIMDKENTGARTRPKKRLKSKEEKTSDSGTTSRAESEAGNGGQGPSGSIGETMRKGDDGNHRETVRKSGRLKKVSSS